MVDLILLAVINNGTGDDQPPPDIGFPVVKKYDGINELTSLKNLKKKTRKVLQLNLKAGFV